MYHAAAPAAATELSVCASSFAAAAVHINGAPGSLRQLPLPAGAAETAVAATLHGRDDGALLATYTIHLTRAGGALPLWRALVLASPAAVTRRTHC